LLDIEGRARRKEMKNEMKKKRQASKENEEHSLDEDL